MSLKPKLGFRMAALMAKCVLILVRGCGVRTIYVPHGAPVRLRETIRNAKVWVKDSGGKPVAGRMDLPEGWFRLPVDDVDDADGPPGGR